MNSIIWISPTLAPELAYLGVAALLCGVIGLERQLSQKSAGVRTHILVGLGSAGFTLVSAYGFSNITATTAIIDPSRIAAQIVSGVGFLGGGVIFMRRDVVRGLTTAASIWLTAAVGMACAAGQLILGLALTVLHILTITVLAPVLRRLPNSTDRNALVITYVDGQGTLRDILEAAAEMGYQTTIRSTKQFSSGDHKSIRACLQFHGRPPLQILMAQLTELSGVEGVAMVNAEEAEWQ